MLPLLLSFSLQIGTVINRHGLSPLTGARPPLCEIPKANKRSNAKKHLFPILYLTQLVSPRAALSLALSLARAVSRTRVSWACLSHAYSRVHPFLLLAEINEIARRYDRYGWVSGPGCSAWMQARPQRARYSLECQLRSRCTLELRLANGRFSCERLVLY